MKNSKEVILQRQERILQLIQQKQKEKTCPYADKRRQKCEFAHMF